MGRLWFGGCFVVARIWFRSRSCLMWCRLVSVGLVFPGFLVLMWGVVIQFWRVAYTLLVFLLCGLLRCGFWSVG